MLEAGAVFEVADGELDGGVVAVELVDGDGPRATLVMNAWCRQSGHSWAWAPSVSRVRRTTRRRRRCRRPLPVT